MFTVYLRSWKIRFLGVIAIVLTVITLLQQQSVYYNLRLARVYPNSSTPRFNRAIFINVDDRENGSLTITAPNSDIFESDNSMFMPAMVGSERREMNPHPYVFVINYPNFCLQHEELVLLIAVISAVSHFEERQAVRETWGGYARTLGAKLLFFLGEDPDPSTAYKVRGESQHFEDIIQENFVDSYLNLSLKTVSIMKWVSNHCPRVKWVLKIDEDNMLNVDRLMKFVRSMNSSNLSMYGMLARNWLPNRSIYSKWYVSKVQYPGHTYPDFLAGPAYLFTGDSAELLYKTSLYTNFFHLEDVYVTGFVALRAGVKRFNLEGITNSHQRITPCLYKNMINSHHYSARDLRRTWFVTQMKFFVCLKDWFLS